MTSAFSGTTPYYNLSRTAHTSAKMSFGSRSAGICKCKNKHKILQFCNINDNSTLYMGSNSFKNEILTVQHFALYASTTGFECLWKVSKRNLIVSMLSSALPEVLPLPNNLSVIVSSLTSKYKI